MSYLCRPHCSSFFLEDCGWWWVSGGKHTKHAGVTFEEINYFTTSSRKPYEEVFNMGSWLWVFLTPLYTPTTITVTIQGNFEDCMEGGICLVTAITPTCAHTYQSLFLAGRPYEFPHQRFRLPCVIRSESP